MLPGRTPGEASSITIESVTVSVTMARRLLSSLTGRNEGGTVEINIINYM